MNDLRDLKNSHVILRAEVGSRLYGTNLLHGECEPNPILSRICQRGTECCPVDHDSGDRDELGVCIEDMEDLAGFGEFEQYIYRSASEREQNHDAPSQTGDLDLTIYGLRKFLRLALKGNPTILQLLFVDKTMVRDARGMQLQALAPYIVSKAAGGAFLGYLQAQRMRFTGERGGSHGATHSEDYRRYGYDTKYAMHMLRLGYQGVEILSRGYLSFPVPEAQSLRAVREGKSNPQDILSRTGELEKEIKGLLDTSPLPKHPDTDYVEAWMLRTYWFTWKAQHGTPGHPLYDKEWVKSDQTD